MNQYYLDYLNLHVGYTIDKMALDQGKLKDNIQKAIEDCFQPAFETAFKRTLPSETTEGDEISKKFADVAVEMIAEPFAEQLSAAIDYYIKNADVHGQMMLMGVSTVGGPTSQVQAAPLLLKASTHPVGTGGGMIPMVNEFYLGIK